MKLERGCWMKAKDDEAEILIYEQIGEDWFGGGISAKRFADDLKALGDIKTLNVRINSPGGSVFDGTTIYNQLVQHKATVNVFIDGIAASAASYVAMAGDTIKIAENGLFMIHNAWGITIGNAADMRKQAEVLDKIDSTIVTTYKKRTKQSEDKLKDWMAAETWFTGAEAVENGFADAIMEAKTTENSFDLSIFKNAPKCGIAAAVTEQFVAEQEYRRRKLDLLKAKTVLIH